MNRFKIFLKFIFISVSVYGLALSCADDGKSRILGGKKDEGGGAPAGSDGTATQTNGSGESNGGGNINGNSAQPTKTNYRIGDEIVKVVETKSWNNDNDRYEPANWKTRIQNNMEMIKIYEPNSNCRYRFSVRTVNLMVATAVNPVSEFDWDCKENEVQCKTENNCTSSELASIDVGPFKQAKGEKKVCTTVTCGNAGAQQVIKVESKIYRHDDSIAEDHVVRQIDYTCSMNLLVGESPNGIDPCATMSGHTSKKERKNTELTSQKEGTGGTNPNAKKSSYSIFSTTTSPTTQEKVGYRSARCVLSGTKLNIALTNSFCTGNGIVTESFVLRNINSVPGAQMTPVDRLPYVAFSLRRELTETVQMCPATLDRTYHFDPNSQCSVTLTVNEADKKLMGKGSCAPDFFYMSPGPTSGSPSVRNTIHVPEFEFLCDAPSLDFTKFL